MKYVRWIIMGLLAYLALSICGGLVLWILRLTKNLIVGGLKIGLIAGAILLAASYFKQRGK